MEASFTWLFIPSVTALITNSIFAFWDNKMSQAHLTYFLSPLRMKRNCVNDVRAVAYTEGQEDVWLSYTNVHVYRATAVGPGACSSLSGCALHLRCLAACALQLGGAEKFTEVMGKSCPFLAL